MFEPKSNLVDVTEQHYVLILINAFQVQSQTVFFSAFAVIFACCLVLYLYPYAFENPEISAFCVSKIREVP